MYNSRHITKQRRRMRVLSLIFLVAYAVVTLPLHDVTCNAHPDTDIVLHSQRDEADPCHVAIYHDRRAGCGHEFHFTEAQSKCRLCLHLHKVDKLFLSQSLANKRTTLCYHGKQILPTAVIAPRIGLASRAPPADFH